VAASPARRHTGATLPVGVLSFSLLVLAAAGFEWPGAAEIDAQELSSLDIASASAPPSAWPCAAVLRSVLASWRCSMTRRPRCA